MLTLIGKRLLFAIPSLIGVVIVTFLLTRALPGDPAAYFAGPAATKEAVDQIRKKLGFDKPLIEQFVRYTGDLAHGDLGTSLTTGQPVAAELRNRLPASGGVPVVGRVVSVGEAVPRWVRGGGRAGGFGGGGGGGGPPRPPRRPPPPPAQLILQSRHPSRARRAFSLSRVELLPRISMDSNNGGETCRPVTATRNGP